MQILNSKIKAFRALRKTEGTSDNINQHSDMKRTLYIKRQRKGGKKRKAYCAEKLNYFTTRFVEHSRYEETLGTNDYSSL
jgi:hypothetical protein